MNEGEDLALEAMRCELERLNRLYAMLSRVNRTIVRVEDPYALYDACCRIAVENGLFDCAWVGLIEPTTLNLTPVARAGAPLDPMRLNISLAELPDGPAAVGRCLSELRPYFVNDVMQSPTLPAGWVAVLAELGLRALAVLPLVANGEMQGVFLVAIAEANYFRGEVVRLLGEVVEDICFALEVMRRDERRAAAESKIRYLAYYDTQTGLPSRPLCSAGGDQEVAVLVISLRQYHGVLQLLGDKADLALMRTVAARLEAHLPTSAIGRISESEFAVILDKTNGLHLIEETAWRIHGALAEAIEVDGREVFLAPFIGIAVHPRDGSDREVLKAAVIAATKGPQDAGSSCRFFVADMDRVSRERLEMDTALRRALERDEFVLYFQPQVDLDSGRVVGAEALLRWLRPGVGLVPPGAFISLLEETGFIVQVGAWVARSACEFARHCQDEGLPPFRVAINLSARQFRDDDVGGLIRQALADSGLDPAWLEIEVTESAVLVNADRVIRTMNELKSLGVSHALDDFGTGYSSLSYLQRLPVERIKIDQSFVSNIASDPGDAAIVRAVVAMAHNLGIKVIAEGVETEGQLGFLRGLLCEEIQGYYFSRPLSGDDFRALLRENRRIPGPPEVARTGRYLLLVDDEPNVISSLRRLLRSTDMQLLAATDVHEAFNLLATHPVGVVVCDQRMPEMTGTEFLRRVKDLYPAVVRIVLSGYTELNSVIDAVNRGAIYKF
jgi:EAL domain-containing protein (putative c-di-GMP-specific phosphodiesterase class I)/CheY-like chemotaxis protein/GGDEF domain-containing protein